MGRGLVGYSPWQLRHHQKREKGKVILWGLHGDMGLCGRGRRRSWILEGIKVKLRHSHLDFTLKGNREPSRVWARCWKHDWICFRKILELLHGALGCSCFLQLILMKCVGLNPLTLFKLLPCHPWLKNHFLCFWSLSSLRLPSYFCSSIASVLCGVGEVYVGFSIRTSIQLFCQLISWNWNPTKFGVLLCAQWCPTLCHPMNCRLPGSSVHGILQSIYSRVVTCCCSVAKSCLTLCDPMDCTMSGFVVLHCLWELNR